MMPPAVVAAMITRLVVVHPVDSPHVRKWDIQLVVVAEAVAVGPLSHGDALVVAVAAASVAIAAPE